MEEKIDSPVKFSNDIYATKQDVIDNLNTEAIDNMRSKIVEYRNFFSMPLNLDHVNGANYNIVLTPGIAQKVNAIERRLFKAMVDYANLNNLSKNEIVEKEQQNILNSFAKSIKVDDKKDQFLFNYVKALNDIKNTIFNEVNYEFFTQMIDLLGTNEFSSIYRKSELKNTSNITLGNKNNTGIPVDSIDSCMNSLYKFIKNSYISPFIKASCAFYYVLYVKPFESYNEEIGALLFKEILVHYDFGPVASLINVERLFLDIEEIDKTIIECKNEHDLTYFVSYMLSKIDICMDSILNDIINVKTKTIQKETYSLDEVSDSPPNENLSRSVVSSGTVAISIARNSLSDEEARQLETSLQELMPELRPMQAAFYARHCTLGSKYTIRQFQKFNSCSYETARSSMDKLVSLGFYRKEPLKNKFIYTPIERK